MRACGRGGVLPAGVGFNGMGASALFTGNDPVALEVALGKAADGLDVNSAVSFRVYFKKDVENAPDRSVNLRTVKIVLVAADAIVHDLAVTAPFSTLGNAMPACFASAGTPVLNGCPPLVSRWGLHSCCLICSCFVGPDPIHRPYVQKNGEKPLDYVSTPVGVPRRTWHHVTVNFKVDFLEIWVNGA